MADGEPGPRAGQPAPVSVAERLERLEALVGALAVEVRTGRLALVDAAGRERLVATVDEEVVELRIGAPPPSGREDASVVLFAAAATDGRVGDDRLPLGPAVGIQLWADGDAVVEIDAAPGVDGGWRPHLHLGGG